MLTFVCLSYVLVSFIIIFLFLFFFLVYGFYSFFFFFFQAEDGIRDTSVTGVQTCALPIYGKRPATRTSGQVDLHPRLCCARHRRSGHVRVLSCEGSRDRILRPSEILVCDRRERHQLDLVYSNRKSTRLNSSHRCISYAVFC